MKREFSFVRLHMSILDRNQIADLIEAIHSVAAELGYSKNDREALMALEAEERYRQAGGDASKRAKEKA
jgi:hypothetical protein